ncbi:MAG: hypothetical protein JO256_05490 [Alphaproteobacteria bacterium]|nr:hypothetical protein [Alphaproteobacteria bacterium]
MIGTRQTREILLLAGVALLMASPAFAAPWVRGFVISNYEPAFYYGAKAGTSDPGTDCPKGANPDNNYDIVLQTPFRTAAQAHALNRPVSETGRDPITVMDSALAHRGFRADIETYINPFAAPDPGFQQVTGSIAEGFDLDRNAKTGGFTSPDGKRGIDNAFYRVMGCGLSYRGVAYQGYLSNRGNDKMLDGLYTMVVRISGSQNPKNDRNAIVEIGYSPDPVVKDATGRPAEGYSFRLAKSSQYTRLKATIRNGVVETEEVAELRVPAFAWYETNRGEALFQKGRVRLVWEADGTLSGLLGGYRDWRDIYAKDTFNVPSGGQSRESTYYQNQIGFYYSLKRNADGIPDPKTGQNTAISAAYRFLGRAAFVVDPAKPVSIFQPVPDDKADRQRELFWQAMNTKAISPEPQRRRPGPLPQPSAAKPERSAVLQTATP